MEGEPSRFSQCLPWRVLPLLWLQLLQWLLLHQRCLRRQRRCLLREERLPRPLLLLEEGRKRRKQKTQLNSRQR